MRSLRSEDRQKQVQGLGYRFLNIKKSGSLWRSSKVREELGKRNAQEYKSFLNPLHVDLVCWIMQISPLSLSLGRHLSTLLPPFWDARYEWKQDLIWLWKFNSQIYILAQISQCKSFSLSVGNVVMNCFILGLTLSKPGCFKTYTPQVSGDTCYAVPQK